MIRCSNCKHWNQWGYCTRIVVRPMVPNPPGTYPGYTYPGEAAEEELRTLGAYVAPDVPSYPAELRTAPEFGCVLGEQKAETRQP